MHKENKALHVIFASKLNVGGVEHETIPSERIVLSYIMLGLEEGTPFMCKQQDIAQAVGIEHKAVGRAVRKLVQIGALKAEKKKNGWHYYSVHVG